jgi:hypothetical protein
MISAFGVDHGEISKLALRPSGKKFKLPKPGQLFGRAGGSKGPAKPNAAFRGGEKVGQGMRGGLSAVGTGAGKATSMMGFQRLGGAMQRNPVKAGVTTSFLGGTAGYGGYGMMKNPKQPKQPGQV